MLRHLESGVGNNGSGCLPDIFEELALAMGCSCAMEAPCRFWEILESLHLGILEADEADIALLAASVNPVRLKNNPIRLDRAALEGLYRQILTIRH